MNNYFNFKGNIYGEGTVVQIAEEYKKEFKFYSNISFKKYDNVNDVYHFGSLYNNWENFYIPRNRLQIYIEKISEPHRVVSQVSSSKVNEDYVEGIVSAWVWYIVIMFFGLFLKGLLNVVGVWILASIIFFTWRHKKMNGR